MNREIDITPEPSDSEREAILRAVSAVLEREESLGSPAAWTLGGWTYRRCGIRDFGRWVSPGRRWTLSARMPWGGREHAELIGRGDAK